MKTYRKMPKLKQLSQFDLRMRDADDKAIADGEREQRKKAQYKRCKYCGGLYGAKCCGNLDCMLAEQREKYNLATRGGDDENFDPTDQEIESQRIQ